MKEIGDKVSVLSSYNYQVKTGKKSSIILMWFPRMFHIHEINTNSYEVITANGYRRMALQN